MNRCPSCGYIVPGAWTECRRCGAQLDLVRSSAPAPAARNGAAIPARSLAPPPPPSGAYPRARPHPETGAGAADDALLPGRRPRDVGPDTMLPAVDPAVAALAPTRARARVTPRALAVGAVVAALVVGAVWSLVPHGHHSPTGPTILAPREPFAGLPTSLSDVVRIEAESSRHTALSVIISAASPNGATLTLAQLTGLQPGYQWLPGNQPSTTNTMISVSSGPGSDVIAVSATSRKICAFGRWSPAAGSTYVTMANVESCAATAAPATGWSPIAGGAAQDLPDETGN